MKSSFSHAMPTQVAILVLLATIAIPNALCQQARSLLDAQEAAQRAQYQEKLQQILADKAGYAAAIVRRWENSARASGRWDENASSDLQAALMKLQPDNLLAASEASSYESMMAVLATGRPGRTILSDPKLQTPLPEALGDSTGDTVFTPITPCRIVDTRFGAAGAIAANTTRPFDMDGTNFSTQGGNSSSCGIPLGVASAVVMTITVTQPAAAGYFTAWAFGTQPLAAVLTYAVGQTIANTTIVPVTAGAGNDFILYSSATAHAVIDVSGYFAAPTATPLDCITVSSAATAVPVNAWTPVDANCPAGRTATGGGYDTTEGTLGYPGVWVTTRPNGNGWRAWVDNQTTGSRTIQTFANCCRVPGR